MKISCRPSFMGLLGSLVLGLVSLQAIAEQDLSRQALEALDAAEEAMDKAPAAEPQGATTTGNGVPQHETPETYSGTTLLPPEQLLLKLESLAAVRNDPEEPTVFRLDRAMRITKIWTYHWNGGRGTRPGTISLLHLESERLMGSWKAVATYHMFDITPGQSWPARGDGPPWLYWTVQPQITLPAGNYEVVDSAPQTWSTNQELGNRGVAWVYGVQQ